MPRSVGEEMSSEVSGKSTNEGKDKQSEVFASAEKPVHVCVIARDSKTKF